MRDRRRHFELNIDPAVVKLIIIHNGHDWAARDMTSMCKIAEEPKEFIPTEKNRGYGPIKRKNWSR